MDWKEFLPQFQNYIPGFGIQIISAIATFVIGIWVAKSVTKFLKKILNRNNVDKTLAEFLSSALKFTLYLFVIIAAVSRLGIETTSLIAVLGAAGLAIGLALQSSLSNVAAGVMLIIFRQIKVGQFIESGDVKGTVEKVGIFNTTLITIENKVIFIPNSKLINDNIINYSEKENRMIDLIVGIGYQDDIDKAKSTLQSIIDDDADILKQPAATIAVGELADSSVKLYIRPWVPNKKAVEVRFRLIEQIKKRFDEENISIPYPQRDVYLHQSK